MPISIISGGSLSGTSINGGDITITFPAGVLQGDVVYACVGVYGTATINTAGYTQLQTGTSGPYNAKVWRKIMGATPDTSITFTGTGSAPDAMAAVVYILRGVDTTTPEDATTPAAATGSSTNPDSPSITTVTRTAWVLSFASSEVNDVAVTAPTGYSGTLQATSNDTRDSTTAVAYKSVDPAGVENPASWTNWDTGTWVAFTVAVRPSGFIEVPVTGVSGTVSVGTVTVKQGTGAAVTGVSATGSVGSVTISLPKSVPVTGVEATGFVGTVAVKEGIGVLVDGVYAEGQVGDLATQTTNILSVSGVEGTTELGSVQVAFPIAVFVTGEEATGAVGSLAVLAGAVVLPDGVYGVTQLGEEEVKIFKYVYPTGVEAVGEVGTVGAYAGRTVMVDGVSCTAQLYPVYVWITVDDQQNEFWVPVNDTQGGGWIEIPT